MSSRNSLSPEEAAEVKLSLEAFEEEFMSESSDEASIQSTPPKRPKRVATLVTGGALGADSAWAEAGLSAGLTVEIMSFEGHKAKVPNGATLHKLTDNTTRAADAALAIAAKRLRRPLPSTRNLYVRNLLRRNHSIVNGADALLAVGSLDKKVPNGDKGVGVIGGTGWSCQLFADAQPTTPATLDMFLFDQDAQSWFQCCMGVGRELSWVASSALGRRWQHIAVIGTRKLSSCGRQAINVVVKSWQ